MFDDKTYAQMRSDFLNKYYNTLRPLLQQYESERVFTLISTSIISGILILIGVAIMFLSFNVTDHHEQKARTQAIFILIGSATVFYYWRKKSFENKIKGIIMPMICHCIGDIKWTAGGVYPSDIYVNSNIITKYTSYRKDDCFEGKYKDVGIIIEECQFIKGSGKNQKTLFDGVMVQLEMNKTFTGNTVIRPDKIFHISPNKNLRHTVLEDVEFEKKFDVFTDDEVEARYLITTALMARLNDMKVAFKADKVSAVFYMNKFIIGLHTSKDLFSICSLIRPVYDEKQIFQMFDEMLSIIKLIEYFKLDQKIGI